MIRPHNNGFDYTKNELELMMQSIKIAKNNQAHGVVFGILQNDKVDLKKNEKLVKLAKDLELKCTFHKAFDECKNINQSLLELSEIGFDWVLTSGKEKNAKLGLQNLKMLSKIKNRKIKILAGGGISGLNYHKFLNLGLDGIHFSIDKNNIIEVEKIMSIKNGLKLY
jgi:copper homeostasis protein